MKAIPQNSTAGFALVVALSMMILLSLLVVGLLSLSSVALRSSNLESTSARARANARLALAMAIGELQKFAGPDTRVTANASLMSATSPNPHWLGVWETRTDEDLTNGNAGVHPIGHDASSLYLTDTRATTKTSEPVRWMVSSPDPEGASPTTETDPEKSIALLQTDRPETTVRAPKIPVENGSIAWWVSDESQKARINLADPYAESKGNESYSLAAAQDFDFEEFTLGGSGSKPLAGLSKVSPSTIASIPTVASASLLPVANRSVLRDNLPESLLYLTTDSAGLFTDVKRSGLKRDLTPFLALGDIPADSDSGLPGLLETDPILPGTHHQKTSPRFGILKSWADLAGMLDSQSGAASIDPQPPATYFQNLPDSAPGPVRDLTNVSKAAIQPVVVEASLGWDFSPYDDGSGAEFLRGHLYPRVILWNPFNVTLNATRYVALLRRPLYGSFTARGADIDSRSDRLYFDDLCGKPQSGFLGFVTESTTLLPGETKVFTPSVESSTGSKLYGKAAKFDPLNYAANVLTADQIPGIENFYFDSQVALPPETTSNRFMAYGFSANMNSFYATPGNGDEFIVAQVVGSAGSRISWGDLTSNNTDYPRVAHYFCQNWGLNRYHKWYGAEKSDHPSNNGTPFREFKPGVTSIGSLDNRRPPRLWRRGVRMAWLDDEAEYIATSKKVPNARFTHPWFSSSNIRGGMFYHPNWVSIPFAAGWEHPAADGFIYFQQPTDPQKFASFFPPSPFGAPDDGLPSTCTLYDIPRADTGIISMGQLQHAQLSYSTWHPSFVIGNSYPTMNADLDATAIKSKVRGRSRWIGEKPWDYSAIIQDGGGRTSHRGEVLIYDLSFEANEELWDRYMISSIPYTGANDSKRTSWTPDQTLPVSRYSTNFSSRFSKKEIEENLKNDPAFPFFHSAEFLVNKGAFNVNSTSIEAWKALLSSLRGLSRESLDGGKSSGDHPLSRSLISGAPGTTSIKDPEDPAAWNAFRSLTDDEIATLSEKIVDEVRRRGPFISLADFINRRLTTDSELASSTALDSAIRYSRTLNRGLDRVGRTDLREVGNVPTAANRPLNITQGIPGFVSQGDLITVLAPALTTRGDTFRIRTCGEASNSDGTVVRAWCEAIVQRTPDYVNPSDDPIIPAITEENGKPTIGPISKQSLAFGRSFKLVSFSWLPSPESRS